jgi:cytoskeletal protein RodZ
MPDKEQVDGYRKAYLNMTNSELIHEMASWLPHAPQHVAARQLLEERRLAAEQRRENIEQARHEVIGAKLDELKKPHWSVPWTFWVALAAAVIALGAWLFPRAPAAPTETSKIVSEATPSLRPPLPANTAASSAILAPKESKKEHAATPATPTRP